MFQVVELPVKQHICKVKSLSKGDANSEVTVYYQVGPQEQHAVAPLWLEHAIVWHRVFTDPLPACPSWFAVRS